MNHKIRAVDLKPGIFVIVSEWFKDMERETDNRHHKAGPLGDPLEVLSVALPFFVVKICQNGNRGVLDSRLMELMVVDRAYVRSLVPNYFLKRRSVSDEEKRRNAGQVVKRYVPGEGWKEIIKETK